MPAAWVVFVKRRHPWRTPLALLLVFFLPVAFSGTALGWGKKISKTGSPAKTAQKVLALGQKYLAKGRMLHEKGKNDLALVELKKAAEADPSLAEAFLLIGEIYTDLQIFEKGAEILEAGVPLAEQEKLDLGMIGQGYCRLARCHQALGKSDLASGDLVKALEYLPNEAMPRRILGDIHQAKGQFTAAIKAYQEAARLEPENPGNWWSLGQAALNGKNQKVVQEALTGLTKADPFKAVDFEKLIQDAGATAEAKKTEPGISEKKAPAAPASNGTVLRGESSKAGEPLKSLATPTAMAKPVRPPEKLQKPIKAPVPPTPPAKPVAKIESELKPIIDLTSEKTSNPVAPTQEEPQEKSSESPVSSETSPSQESVLPATAQDPASQEGGTANQHLIDLVKESDQERNSSPTEPLAPIDDPYAVEPADQNTREN